jgi:hypothetical protein
MDCTRDVEKHALLQKLPNWSTSGLEPHMSYSILFLAGYCGCKPVRNLFHLSAWTAVRDADGNGTVVIIAIRTEQALGFCVVARIRPAIDPFSISSMTQSIHDLLCSIAMPLPWALAYSAMMMMMIKLYLSTRFVDAKHPDMTELVCTFWESAWYMERSSTHSGQWTFMPCMKAWQVTCAIPFQRPTFYQQQQQQKP